jgi:hypothetical protein
MASSASSDDGDFFFVLCVLLVVGLPAWAIEYAGTPRVVRNFVVSEKHFDSGRDACYRLSLALDGGQSNFCVQPEEYAAIHEGESVEISARRGRVSGHWYVVGLASSRERSPR